ncbi:RDD family protein [Evansella tamaricis]|uniref:RDD family protein n=1 Tax=Evansella tamaricis TaxID=2069301 RepID=A0ABS6JM48_9BACI|nr:RDD family protein [Evansella tamaricis]MBU9714656.1 RDD family protein [Evansella tamaricis]
MSEHKGEIVETDTDGLWERKLTETPYYAGFWMRLWAYLIDLVVISSISGIILTPFFRLTDLSTLNIGIYSIGGILGASISFGYFIILTKKWGQTLGKRILGIKVLPQKEEFLTWKSTVMRELVGRYIHQSLFLTNIIYLIVAFHPEKKGLHDYFADTLVVLEPRKKGN